MADGALWPTGAPYQKAIWAAVSVSDPEGEVQRAKDGTPEPDPDLRDYENVALDEDIDAYFAREVTPHVPDAWIDRTRPRSATRSPSPATSTSTLPRAPSPRSTPNSATWSPRSRSSWAR